MRALIHFDSHFLGRAESRDQLVQETGRIFKGLAYAVILLAGLFAVDVWDWVRFLPEGVRPAYASLLVPCVWLVALVYLMREVDAAVLGEGEDGEAGVAQGLLTIASVVIEFAGALAILACVGLIWNGVVTVGGLEASWGLQFLQEPDARLPLLFVVHLMVAYKAALLFSTRSSWFGLLMGSFLLPFALEMTRLRAPLSITEPAIDQLAKMSGMSILLDRLGTAEFERDVIFLAGVLHLLYLGAMLLMTGAAFALFRSRITQLRQRAEAEPELAQQTPPSSFHQIGDFANRYRVVDIDNYDYFSERRAQ